MLKSRAAAALVAFFVVTLLGAPLVVALNHAQDRNRVTMCANNLSQLWKMQMVYMSQFGGRMKAMPTETGSDFWLKLTKTTPPLIDKEVGDLLQCPVKNKDEGWGSCAYRGPSISVSKLAGTDPVGADIDGNHGVGKGGNVLTKAGDVTHELPGTDLWKHAADKTAIRPAEKAVASNAAPNTESPQDLESRVKALEAEVRRLKLMLLLNYCADASGGHVNKDHFAFLGIKYDFLKKETSETFGLSEGEGLKLTLVVPDGPAGKVGIEEGDVLLRVNGTPLKSSKISVFEEPKGGFGGGRSFVLANYVTYFLPGESVELETVRKGEKKKVRVQFTCKTCGEKCPFWGGK